jgi:hypothetical protein
MVCERNPVLFSVSTDIAIDPPLGAKRGRHCALSE